MARSGGLPSVRSASNAKSIIMMAFFFTIPISRMMPINAMTLNSIRRAMRGQQGAYAGGRQGREDRQWMNVALVQNTEHDIDRDQGGQDQQRFMFQRMLKTPAPRPGNSRGYWQEGPTPA